MPGQDEAVTEVNSGDAIFDPLPVKECVVNEVRWGHPTRRPREQCKSKQFSLIDMRPDLQNQK